MTVKELLRNTTREVHENLHELGIFQDLSRQRLSQRQYRFLIERLFGFYEPLDTALVDATNCRSRGPSYCPRSPLLSADLSALGTDLREQERLPRCASLPRIETREEVLGSLYVVEGSVLGGKLIFKQLDCLFDTGTAKGRSYFKWCAEQPHHRWTYLCADLEARNSHADTVQELIDAADTLFHSLLNWISVIDSPALAGAGTSSAD